jgi:UDP-GlcNAc:undecaprenyl-phosphate GlcNAc-1-phosphate transferase
MEIHYLILGIILSFIGLVVYKKLGKRYKIHDEPNERSSHTQIVIRGGGVVLLLLNILMLVVIPSKEIALLSLSLSIAVLTGFVDDIKGLGTGTRFFLYFVTVAILLFGVVTSRFIPIYYFIPLFIVILGAVNTYNFMDGINGMTSLYSIVFLASSGFILWKLEVMSFTIPILLYGSFFIAFTWFNFRKKALLFLGDSGSVAMGLFSALIVLLIGFKLSSMTSIVLLSVYGVDSVGTIILRLIKKENILKAHRSHLYQDLVHLKGYSQLQVSAIYALLQAVINVVYITVFSISGDSSFLFLTLSILALIYVIAKKRIHGKSLFVSQIG